MVALNPTVNMNKCSGLGLRCLRAAYLLTKDKMLTSMPLFHQQLLEEGCTERGVEAVLSQALRSGKHSNEPRLIYITSELISDIKNCKYGLGWDTLYKNCHMGPPPFAVLHMYQYRYQESNSYRGRIEKASTTTVDNIEKG